MNANGALDFTAPAIQSPERKVGLDGIGVRIHELQEHVERPIGLLGDEIIEPGEIVGMQFAERHRPALAPAEVTGEDAQNQRANTRAKSAARISGMGSERLCRSAPEPVAPFNRGSADPHRR